MSRANLIHDIYELKHLYTGLVGGSNAGQSVANHYSDSAYSRNSREDHRYSGEHVLASPASL